MASSNKPLIDNNLSYEAARDELITTVTKLEQGGLSLDESLSLWEKGEALIAHCRTKLAGASTKIAAVLEEKPED